MPCFAALEQFDFQWIANESDNDMTCNRDSVYQLSRQTGYPLTSAQSSLKNQAANTAGSSDDQEAHQV